MIHFFHESCLPRFFWKAFFGSIALMVFAGCGNGDGNVEGCLEDGTCVAVLDVARFSVEMPLNPEDPFWVSDSSGKAITVELGPQMITNPKWPDPSIKNIKVRAVQNDSSIAIYLEWKDETVDNKYGHSTLYSDQAAVMFPLHPQRETLPIFMGAEETPVNIWQWKAIWEQGQPAAQKGKRPRPPSLAPEEQRASPVEDLNAEGFSTLTSQNQQDVQGKGVWRDQVWRVVLKRSLTNRHPDDVQFKNFSHMAIAVWNGDNRERNGQKGISDWILLRFP